MLRSRKDIYLYWALVRAGYFPRAVEKLETVLPGGQRCGGARSLNINGANENDNNEHWISVSVLFWKMFTAAQFCPFIIYNDKHY